ncbi:hypothetical protein GC163_00205 [bacterium]|nr:hypothetical protein [bacterium]
MDVIGNSMVSGQIKTALQTEHVSLPEEFVWIEPAAFQKVEHCYFFSRFSSEALPSPNQFFDETEIECLTNHFHFRQETLMSAICVSVSLFQHVHRCWSESPFSALSIRQYISFQYAREFDNRASTEAVEGTYRFHVDRPNQSYYDSNIENYREPFLMCY